MYSRKTRSKNARKCKNKSLKMKGGSSKKMRLFTKKLKAIGLRFKNKRKGRKTKQKGGRVGMPIEYYGGKSNVWTNSPTSTTGKNIQSGYTWNDFSNVKPKC